MLGDAINYRTTAVRCGHDLQIVFMIFSKLNKSDFEDPLKNFDNEFIKKINLNHFKHLHVNKTVAIEGKGILDSFNKLISFIFPQLTLKM